MTERHRDLLTQLLPVKQALPLIRQALNQQCPLGGSPPGTHRGNMSHG